MKHRKEKIAEYIFQNVIFFLIIYSAYLLKIRFCLIYNIFKIPCPGCGLTRATAELLKGNLIESLKYNALLIPLALSYLIYSYAYIKDVFNNTSYLNNTLIKYKRYFIVLSLIVVIIIEIINLNNVRLYY